MEASRVRTTLTAKRPAASNMRAVRHDELALYHAAAAEKKCSGRIKGQVCGASDWHVTHRIQGIAFVVRHIECRRCGAKDQIAARR